MIIREMEMKISVWTISRFQVAVRKKSLVITGWQGCAERGPCEELIGVCSLWMEAILENNKEVSQNKTDNTTTQCRVSFLHTIKNRNQDLKEISAVLSFFTLCYLKYFYVIPFTLK